MVSARKGRAAKVEPMDTSPVRGAPGSDEIIMEEERVLNTYDDDSDIAQPHNGPFDLEQYCNNIGIEIVNESEDGMQLEFDLTKVEAPIANALRRVLIAEVPTMAIEKIYLYQNTSVIQDEVLCHRIGLLPIFADPREFEWPTETIVGINEKGVDCDEEPAADETRNLVFNFNVSCTRNRNAPKGATEPNQLFHNATVYSKSFEWQAVGDQATRWTDETRPRMVHDDIIVAKMRPGQQIEASCHVVKGIGRDHAKFSPVAVATYRLLPTIRLLESISGEPAERLQKCFSNGVISIGSDGNAKVKDARNDTCSRNVFRYDDLAGKVQLGRNKQHFIFSVESTGALKSGELVVEACRVMQTKARSLKEQIAAALAE